MPHRDLIHFRLPAVCGTQQATIPAPQPVGRLIHHQTKWVRRLWGKWPSTCDRTHIWWLSRQGDKTLLPRQVNQHDVTGHAHYRITSNKSRPNGMTNLTDEVADRGLLGVPTCRRPSLPNSERQKETKSLLDQQCHINTFRSLSIEMASRKHQQRYSQKNNQERRLTTYAPIWGY